jgi:hypothetical protein
MTGSAFEGCKEASSSPFLPVSPAGRNRCLQRRGTPERSALCFTHFSEETIFLSYPVSAPWLPPVGLNIPDFLFSWAGKVNKKYVVNKRFGHILGPFFMSRFISAIDTSQILCYLSFCSMWRLY